MSRKLAVTITLLVGSLLVTVAVVFLPHGASKKHSPVSHRLIKDQTSRVVAVPERPQRILSQCSTATDTLVRLGQLHRLCAVDEFNRSVPGIGSIPCISKGSAISREQIQALKVDLAFVWWFQDDTAHLLEDMSIPVIRIRTGRAGTLAETIRLIGECVNCGTEATRLAQSLNEWAAKNTSPPTNNCPRVYIELYGPLKTIGKDSYTNDVIEMAGGHNIAAGKSGRVLFSVEELVQADPDVILVVGEPSALQAVLQRPEMERLRAVRTKRAFAVPPAWLIPGAELPVAVMNFRAIIHTNNSKE